MALELGWREGSGGSSEKYLSVELGKEEDEGKLTGEVAPELGSEGEGAARELKRSVPGGGNR